MKNLMYRFRSTYLLLFVLAFATVACNNDNDPTPSGGNGVEGSWNISAIKVDPAMDGVSDYLQVINLFLGNDCLSRITFNFRGNGTLTGDVPKECQDAEAAAEDFGVGQNSKWEVKGNKIVLTSGTDVSEYDLDVNKTTMGWSYSEVDEDDGKTYRYTIEFKRK